MLDDNSVYLVQVKFQSHCELLGGMRNWFSSCTAWNTWTLIIFIWSLQWSTKKATAAYRLTEAREVCVLQLLNQMVLDILLGLLGKGKMACSSYLRVTRSHVARAGQDMCISKAYWLADGGGAHPLLPFLQLEKIPIMCRSGHRAVRCCSFKKRQESDFLCEVSQVWNVGRSFQRQNERQCKSQVKQKGRPRRQRAPSSLRPGWVYALP